MDHQILMTNIHSSQAGQNISPTQAEVTENDIRTALDKIVLDSLKPVSVALFVLYTLLVINRALFWAGANAPAITIMAAATALSFLLLRFILERQQIPVALAHPIGVSVAGLVLLNSLLHLYLLADPRHTTYLLLLIVGVGSLMLSFRWLASFIGVAIVAWGTVVWLAAPAASLVHFGYGLPSAIIIAFLVYIARVKILRRLEELHLQNKYQKEEFQTLYQSEFSRRRLAETLYRMGGALSQILNLAEVLDLLLEDLAEIVTYDRAAVLLQSDDELEVVAARGFPPEVEPNQLRIPIQHDADDVYRRVYHTQQPLTIPDVLDWPNWQQVENLPAARAWLGVPLTYHDEVIGMLSLTRELPDAYGDEEVTLTTTFASQAAIALENARLYDQLLRFNEDLEDEVEERTSDLQVAYIELERIDQAKSDFVSVASHELRTPLTVLRGYSGMLLKDPKVRENSTHLKMVAGIQAGAIRLTEIVTNLTDMAKIDNSSLDLYPETLSISLLIQLVSHKFEPSLIKRNLTLTMENMDNLPPIDADPDALRKVFSHLLSNAMKYTPDGGTITITGQVLANGTEEIPRTVVKITVSDTGIGIDRYHHRLIFSKFYQIEDLNLHSSGKTKFKGSGPGLGLTISRGIIEAHQGKIWAESRGYDEETFPGSSFHVVLPLKWKEEVRRSEIGD